MPAYLTRKTRWLEAERRDALLRRLLKASGWQLTREVIEAARLRHLARVSEGITAKVFATLSELAIEVVRTRSERITDEAIEAWKHAGWALSRELNWAVRNLDVPVWGSRDGGSPRLERFISEDAERAAGGEMALDVEGVEDSGVNRQKALG